VNRLRNAAIIIALGVALGLIMTFNACRAPDPAVPTPPATPTLTAAPSSPSPSLTPPNQITGTVLSVTDGDTFRVRSDGGLIIVRPIGIDTPETKDPNQPVQCYGPEATRAAESLLLAESVLLTPDPSQDQVDRYGRTLAYVQVVRGNVDFGQVMIEAGAAREYTYNARRPYARQAAYRAVETQAKAAGLGLWGRCL
jgi:micrococcal nuclease